VSACGPPHLASALGQSPRQHVSCCALTLRSSCILSVVQEKQDCTESGGVMATTMRAGDLTLHDLGARFGLQLTKDATFFLGKRSQGVKFTSY